MNATQAQQQINSLTWEDVQHAISLGYVNYNGLTDAAKAETDLRMGLLLERRDALFLERRNKRAMERAGVKA